MIWTCAPDIPLYGRDSLIRCLLKQDLVDEPWLRIVPITLGTGKGLFAEGTLPVAFCQQEAKPLPTGVIVASYQRAGEVQTDTF